MSAKKKKKTMCVNKKIIEKPNKEYSVEELIKLGEKKNKLKLMPTLYDNKKPVNKKEQEN